MAPQYTAFPAAGSPGTGFVLAGQVLWNGHLSIEHSTGEECRKADLGCGKNKFVSVIGAVIGEFVGAEKGLGFLVIESTSHFKTPLAFGAMVLLALMSIVLFGAVAAIERVVCPWYGRQH